MNIHQLVSDILGGKVRVLSFDDVASGPDTGIITGALSALNFARLAFAAQDTTPVISQVIRSLSSKKMVEDALVSNEGHRSVGLEVEDVWHIPLFEASLNPVSTNYGTPSIDHVTKILQNLCTLNSSTAVLFTRHPDVVVCLRLKISVQELFVIFNPQATAEPSRQAVNLIFTTSLPQIVQQLCDIFPTGKVLSTQENIVRRAQSLEKCSTHVFVPRNTTFDSEGCLVVSSVTLLMLKAELEGLKTKKGGLNKEKQRLERSIVDLGARLAEEKAKTMRTQPPKAPLVKAATRGPSVSQGSRLTQSSYSSRKRESVLDVKDELDPNLKFALQLQATFDSENDFLMKQKHELILTAQRQYHCGICLDDFPEDDAVRIDSCGHEICRDCARGHVCSKIEEHRFPVLCPVCMADTNNKNPGTIPSTLVQLLGVSEKQWETWVEMELAQFSILFTCRKCLHSAFVDRQDLEAQAEIHCPFPACNYVWCKECQQAIDPDGPKHSCDGTSELDHLMKQQGWRYCPNCKTPIQKTQGCNHLSCIAPGCNTHFCYGCGATINRTAIPQEIQEGKTAHFRNCPIV